MQLTKGKLLFANAVAFIALVGLLAETRYKLVEGAVLAGEGRAAEAAAKIEEAAALLERGLHAALAQVRSAHNADRHRRGRFTPAERYRQQERKQRLQ